MKHLLFLLSLIIPLLVSGRVTSCQLKLFSYDEENWRNASFGLIQGLYYNAPKDCTLCKSFSSDMVLINRGYVGLELTQNTWKNYNTWLTSNPY